MNERKSRVGVIIILLITILSLIPLRSLKFEFNIEKFFPSGDTELAFFREFQQQFSSQIDDEFIFIGLKNKAGIFDQPFLIKTDSLSRYISRLPNIIKLYSLTTTNLIYFNKEELNARPLIHLDKPALYADDSSYLFKSHEYRDLLVSKDGKSIAIAAFNQEGLTDAQKDTLLDNIQKKILTLGFDETHLTAKVRVEREYVREIGKNLSKYMLVSLALICIVLYILFRTFKAIFIPLLVILLTVMWTLSLISLTGHTLDIISSLLPPILAAICMSDVIHITSHYIELLRTGLSKKEALNKAYKEVGLATFYTCCTIAVGFITLGITNIVPIRNFGFFAAAGILLGFGITLVVLYAFYSMTPVPAITHKKRSDYWWNRFLAFSFRKLMRYKVMCFSILALCTVVSVYFVSKIEINSSLLQEIPRHNPMLNDYRYMEKDFSGTRPFELSLTIKGKGISFFELPVLKQVEVIETYLKDSCGIGYVISPLSMFRGATKAFNGGDNIFFRLPGSQLELNHAYESVMQTEFAGNMEHYLTADGSRLRISGRLPNLSVKEFKPVSDKIAAFFERHNAAFKFTHQVTGSAVLLDKVTYSLTENLFTGIFSDALIICIIALLLLRNWVIMLIVLIPNLLPLLFMGALMGLLKIDLKADTSVIFAVALGLAVDDTIHFLSRFRLELSRGLSIFYAVKRTYLSTGKAIIITNLVLLSGFIPLLTSSFGGTFYIGLLVSACLFCAMILELTITPLLILLLYKKKR